MVKTTAGEVRVLSSAELLESNEWQGMKVQDLAVGETHPVPGAEDLLGGITARASFWRHDGGTLPYARPSSSELIYVVQGKVGITSDAGSSVIVTEGDAAFIPQGFVGSWTSILPVLKLSISVQSPTPAELSTNTASCVQPDTDSRVQRTWRHGVGGSFS